MLFTRNGWTTLSGGEEHKVTTHMIILIADQDDNEWANIMNLLPKLFELIERHNLTHAASISVGATLLTIALNNRKDEYFPDDVSIVQNELSALIPYTTEA
jgi:hypothetical protein